MSARTEPAVGSQPGPAVSGLGYGTHWDAQAQLWRVRNENTGQWLYTSGGALAGWSSFLEADGAWRAFEPPLPAWRGR